MSKKRKKTRSDIVLPGWESQNVVKCFLREEKASEKPCEKVGFSQIKRVNKEDMRMEMEFDKEKALLEIEAMYRARRRGRRIPKKKIVVFRKKKQPDDKPPQNGKSEVENKDSNNSK